MFNIDDKIEQLLKDNPKIKLIVTVLLAVAIFFNFNDSKIEKLKVKK